jgi:succinate-semialdehyde dehydrogenase/glutarate-semialdehyde dehydrogenase
MSFSEEFWTVDPSTGGKLASYTLMEPQTCLRYARNSSEAFASWKEVSFEGRAELLRSLAGTLRREREKLARMMTHEMGKPIKQSQAEVEKCAWTAEVIAREGAAWLKGETVETDARRSRVSFEPLGVILGVEPWNFPSWQALRFAIPNVMAGNVVLLRHSNVVPGSALLLEEVFKEAGFPDGVFKVLLTGHKVIQDVISSPLVRGVSFTGSNAAGSVIASLAGRFTKKSVMELGGSDPFIVLDDADLKAAAQAGAESRLINSGQSCINAKRFIVMDSAYEEFRDLFVT